MIFKRICVTCDGCNDTASDDCGTVADAVEEARSEGFHLRPGGRHICPECWEAGER